MCANNHQDLIAQNQPIIIFDGVCNLCNQAVNFIIRRDDNAIFLFTPMQSQYAQNLLKQHHLDNFDGDSVLLIKAGACYLRTNAALEIAKDLDGLWFMFNILKIIPSAVRDFFYNLLAHNRYRLFGQRNHCMVPTDEVRKRFIM